MPEEQVFSVGGTRLTCKTLDKLWETYPVQTLRFGTARACDIEGSMALYAVIMGDENQEALKEFIDILARHDEELIAFGKSLI